MAVEKWHEALLPIGKNPFEVVSKYRTWAGALYSVLGRTWHDFCLQGLMTAT